MLSMLNPSVNDYLTARMKNNGLEKSDLLSSAIVVTQLKRLLTPKELEIKLKSAFSDGTILEYEFLSEQEKINFIAYFVSYHNVLDFRYAEYVHLYLNKIEDMRTYEKQFILAYNIFEQLLEKEVCTFYKIKDLLSDFDILTDILNQFQIEDLVAAINECNNLYGEEVDFIEMCQELLADAIEEYFSNIDVSEFDIDIPGGVDWDDAISDIENEAERLAREKIKDLLNELPQTINNINYSDDTMHVSVYGAEELLKNDYCDIDDNDREDSQSVDYDQIDIIFNR